MYTHTQCMTWMTHNCWVKDYVSFCSWQILLNWSAYMPYHLNSHLPSAMYKHLILYTLKDLYWLFLREMKGQEERETPMREQNIDWMSPACPLPGIEPQTMACAMTRKGTINLLIQRVMPNRVTLARTLWSWYLFYILNSIYKIKHFHIFQSQ